MSEMKLEHYDEATGRLLCDETHPYTLEREHANHGKNWVHQHVVSVGDQDDDFYLGTSYQRYMCTVCGKSWTSELPE